MEAGDLLEGPPVHLRLASAWQVSNRTFLRRLGGKIEVTPKVALNHRGDRSRVHPGAAQACLIVAERPEDVRRLTIKRNTVAVVRLKPLPSLELSWPKTISL